MATQIRHLHQQLRGLPQSHPVLTLTVTNTGLAAIADTLGQVVTQLVAIGSGAPASPLTFDVMRLLRFTLYQCAITPILYQWLLFLERTIPVPIVPPPNTHHAASPGALEAGGATASSSASSMDMVIDSATPLLGGGGNRKSIADLVVAVQPIVLDVPSTRASAKVLVKPVLKRVVLDQFVFAPISMAVFFVCMTIMEGGGPAQIQQKLYEAYWTCLFSNWKVWPLVQFLNFLYIPLFFRLPFVSTVGIIWNTYLSILNGRTVVVSPGLAPTAVSQ